MNTDLITMHFHTKASQLLLLNYEELKLTVAGIDRNNGEAHFQQLTRHQLDKLKQRLEKMPAALLQDHGSYERINAVNPHLNTLAKDYLHQFRQKTKLIKSKLPVTFFVRRAGNRNDLTTKTSLMQLVNS